MAIIQMGAIVAKLSGKVGGQTFGNNKAGSFLKNTGSYKKTLSNGRQNAISGFLSNNQLWRTFSSVQQASWNAGTVNFPYINRFGVSKEYSGYQLATKFNGNLKVIGGSPIATCPAVYTLGTITGWSMNSGGGNISTVGATVEDNNCTYLIYVTAPVSAGRVTPSLNFKLIAVQTSAQFGSSTLLTTEYQAQFGDLVLGNRVHYYVDAVHNDRGIRFEKIRVGSFILA